MSVASYTRREILRWSPTQQLYPGTSGSAKRCKATHVWPSRWAEPSYLDAISNRRTPIDLHLFTPSEMNLVDDVRNQ